jgi:hypothetical protein
MTRASCRSSTAAGSLGENGLGSPRRESKESEGRVNLARPIASNAERLATNLMKAKMLLGSWFLAVLTGLAANTVQAEESWRMSEGPLQTRWAKEVSPENALPEYP